MAPGPFRLLMRVATAVFVAISMFEMAPTANAASPGLRSEFTVVAREPIDSLRDDVILVLHGFGSAIPNGTFEVLFRAFSDTHSVIGFNYDYARVDHNVAEFDQLYEKYLQGHRVTVIGTSLGGFWAMYWAQVFPTEALLVVNPIIEPAVDMLPFVGTTFSEKRGKYYTINADDWAHYKTVELGTPRVRTLVLLSARDPTIPPKKALAKFGTAKNARIVTFDTDLHSVVTQIPEVIDAIARFLTAPPSD